MGKEKNIFMLWWDNRRFKKKEREKERDEWIIRTTPLKSFVVNKQSEMGKQPEVTRDQSFCLVALG